MKIAICMMLKDEAKTVIKSLESVLPIADCYIISIDESSKDQTENLVRGWLDNHDNQIKWELNSHVFNNDFAARRNALIDFAEDLEIDYVLTLDGHEYFTEKSLGYLQKLKEDGCNFDVIDFNIMMDHSTVFQQPRMFKSSIRYEFAIHNTITHIDNRVAMPQVSIIHDQPLPRYLERRAQRSIMNIEGLKANNDPRSIFYLATQYYEMADFINAENQFEKYLMETDFEAEEYQARLYLSSCYNKLNNPAQQEKVLIGCFNNSEPRNEHLIALGNFHFENQSYTKAKYFYRLATAVKMPQRFLIIDIDHYRFIPWYKLMEACLASDDIDGAMEAIRKGKQFTPVIEDFYTAEKQISVKVSKIIKAKKGSIYVVDSLQTFIIPILGKLKQEYFIRVDSQFNPDNAIHANVIFCDWADDNAIAVANYETLARKILRVHSYEVYTDKIMHLDFSAFDDVIFVSNHIKKYIEERIGSVIPHGSVVPNGVDLIKYSISKGKVQNNKVAWAGRLAQVKGIQNLFGIAALNPKMEFHIAGSFQERDLERWCQQQLVYLKNIIMYPWQKDLNEFYSDKTYAISTSIREGCPVALIEAMACGLEPVILNWPGAENLFKKKGVFQDIQSIYFNSRVDFESNRNFVINNFNLEKQIDKIYSMVNNLIQKEKI